MQTPDEQGVYASHIFLGLRLPVQAMLAGKLAEVLAAVQQGVQTQEHADFVKTLNPQGSAA
jgi:hypothetical protein